jgi:hypothetical protein
MEEITTKSLPVRDYDIIEVTSHELVQGDPKLSSTMHCLILMQEAQPMPGATCYPATVPNRVEKFRRDNPNAPGIDLEVLNFDEVITIFSALVDTGFLSRSIIFASPYGDEGDECIPYDGLTPEEHNEVMAELGKSEVAMKNVSEKYNLDIQETRKHPEYQKARGDIAHPETGEAGCDPYTTLFFEYHWTDKIKITPETMDPSKEDIMEALISIFSPEQAKSVYDAAKLIAFEKQKSV